MNQIIHPQGHVFSITQIIKEKGKFNAVYLANDARNGKQVLLKKLNAPFNEQSLSQFKKEFLFNLDHPNIIQTIDYFSINNEHYLVREFESGVDTKSYLKKNSLTPSEAIYGALEILKALSALHRNNTIHCDIRPANVLIQKKDILNHPVKLLDLGMAKNEHEPVSQKPFALIYAAPEQVLQHLDLICPATDLYALGIMMHEWITGRVPFYNANPELLLNIQLTQPLPKHQLIPTPLLQVLHQATAKTNFAKPPRMYSREQVNEMIYKAQMQRYQNAETFTNALLEVKSELNKPKHKSWFGSFLLTKFNQ